jgi:hypothetical protein
MQPRARISSALLAIALTAPDAAARAADHVIHVSVDGLHAGHLEALLAGDVQGDYAHFARFVDEGATTFNARADFTHTNTIPNHTTMLSGRPVLQPAGQSNTVHHGYTNNGTPDPNDTLHNAGNPALSYVQSVFDVAHDRGLRTALYASKSKFVIYEQSYDADSGAADPVAPDDGADKIDAYDNRSTGNPANASNLHQQFLTDMVVQRFHYAFVHYRDPDSAGHAAGWGSPTWNAAVAGVDDYLGDLFALVEADPTLDGATAIILTSDHGGSGNGHGAASDPNNYRIPFFVWGAEVVAGADLYVLDPQARADPGMSRPDYDAPVPPIRNGDSGNLALHLLGLPAIEGSTINSSQELRVTGPAAIPVASPRMLWLTALLLAAALLLRAPKLSQRKPHV